MGNWDTDPRGTRGRLYQCNAGGGSVITVPVMILLGVPGPVAHGTNRLPIFAHNISAALTYIRHGLSRSGMILSLSLCAVPWAVAGALVGVRIPAETLNLILAAVMVVGNAAGGWLSARLTLKGGEPVIRWVVVLSIAGMIVKLIWLPSWKTRRAA